MTSYAIDIDVLYPRDEEHRFRLYARRGEELDVLAVAPTWGGVGEAIGCLDEDERARDRRLMDRGAFGILDAVEGRWVVLPWHRPDGRPTFGRDRTALRESRGWEGQTVRARSRPRRRGGHWLVGERGPHGRYRLTPLGAAEMVRPISRSAADLARNWEIVDPKGTR